MHRDKRCELANELHDIDRSGLSFVPVRLCHLEALIIDGVYYPRNDYVESLIRTIINEAKNT